MHTRVQESCRVAGAASWTLPARRAKDRSCRFRQSVAQPDVAPVMLNKELPFRYPPALYAQKVQGNVTLRIYHRPGWSDRS